MRFSLHKTDTRCPLIVHFVSKKPPALAGNGHYQRETPNETPREKPNKTPNGSQTGRQTISIRQASYRTRGQTKRRMSSYTPNETPNKTPSETTNETLSGTLNETPNKTPNGSQTSFYTPNKTAERAPIHKSRKSQLHPICLASPNHNDHQTRCTHQSIARFLTTSLTLNKTARFLIPQKCEEQQKTYSPKNSS